MCFFQLPTLPLPCQQALKIAGRCVAGHDHSDLHTRCMFCYEDHTSDYHPACAKKLFNSTEIPQIGFSLSDIVELASQTINERIAIPGVQPKMLLDLKKEQQGLRFTIVGLWGRYIFKPPFEDYPRLPENEDLTMHLASIFGIAVATYGLIRLGSGELGYLAKRFDRKDEKKLAVEDLCQLSELPTTNKYYSAIEKVGKILRGFVTNPGYEMIRLFELVVFSFLSGNADMHLKNFSVITDDDGEITLAPAYDLVATALAIPKDTDESALTINGKKAKLTRKDFSTLADNLQIQKKAAENSLERFEDCRVPRKKHRYDPTNREPVLVYH